MFSIGTVDFRAILWPLPCSRLSKGLNFILPTANPFRGLDSDMNKISLISCRASDPNMLSLAIGDAYKADFESAIITTLSVRFGGAVRFRVYSFRGSD